MLVITDGNDNTSDETLEQLVREARQSGVLIYSIGLLERGGSQGEARAAKRALKALAEASGGLDYYPKNLAEVEKITPQDCQRDPQSVPAGVFTARTLRWTAPIARSR